MTARRNRPDPARRKRAAPAIADSAADIADDPATATATAAATTATGPAPTATPADQRRRRQVELNLLRPIPGDTPMHRLWAGTKLVALAILALVLGLKPTWPVIAAGAGLVIVAWIVARIPRGSLPRFPRWFWVGIAVGA
ncbi:MAG: energy-coupling factor transport system permease/ATP-binding protein, partial [Acidimicrobiaceae bacterium]|nr:energy-coupling factor transport system permease/ATP-binding protein [Acidimicrobiaceae bacterium]